MPFSGNNPNRLMNSKSQVSEKIIVGMSGGVDSSVTALTLLQQGYDITGLFMKNWEEDDDTGQCTAIEDLADAQQVCDKLGIALKTVNFSAEYWDDVFAVCLDEFRAGRTPNPDILCNQQIKFKAFMDFASDLGGTVIATGHYAQIHQDEQGHYHLIKGLDAGKDQSYFLYTLGQAQLQHSLFPMGGIQKSAVRAMAEQAGFITHNKKDSTGICFIGERKFKTFLQRFLPAQPGDMQTPEGQIIAQHQGLMYYTLGQRQGLGIGGVAGKNEDPWYVLAKDMDNNRLIVGQGHNHPMMFHQQLEACSLSWVSGHPLHETLRCQAKTRYRQPDQDCQVTPIDNNRCLVQFTQAQRAMTPGQSVVFYQQDECLGGGIIDRVM